MAGFISSFSDVLGTFSEHRYLDDGIDRLNRIYTPVILISTASIMGVIQFVGDPIECSMDNKDAPTDYAKDYIKSWCWTHGTYDNIEGKNPVHLNYYQWVPVVIALQAFFFQLPYIFWATMANAGGMNLAKTLEGCETLNEVMMSLKQQTRVVVCEEIVHIIDGYLKPRIFLPGRRSCMKRTFYNLVTAFFIAKFLYVLNIVAQLYAIDSFFRGKQVEIGDTLYEDKHENVIEYSFRAIFGLLDDGVWENSWRFPMLAMCRYYSEGRLAFNCKNRETDIYGVRKCPMDGEVLCTLPLNLYNDKVFAVMILLMMGLMIASIVYLFIWVYRIFVPSSKNALILKLLVDINDEEERDVYRFIEDYLKSDGILVLKLIRHNMGVNTCSEVTEGLFKQFLAQDEKFRSSLPPIHSFLPVPEEDDDEPTTPTKETTITKTRETTTSSTSPPQTMTTNVPTLSLGSLYDHHSIIDERSMVRLMTPTSMTPTRFNNGALPTLTELSTPRSGDGEEDEEESLLKERVMTPV